MPSAAGAAASAAGAAAAVVICCGVLWQRQRARQRRVLMARETGARPKNAEEEEEFAADWSELPRCVVEAQLKEAREELSAAQEELRELQEHRQAAARLKRESSKRHEASRRRSCSAEELRPAQEPAAGAWTQLRYTTGLPIPLHAIGVVRSCYEDCQGTPHHPNPNPNLNPNPTPNPNPNPHPNPNPGSRHAPPARPRAARARDDRALRRHPASTSSPHLALWARLAAPLVSHRWLSPP